MPRHIPCAARTRPLQPTAPIWVKAALTAFLFVGSLQAQSMPGTSLASRTTAEPEAFLETSDAASREEITARLSRVRRRVEELQARHSLQQVPMALLRELELLKWLDLLYSNREANATRKAELQIELEVVGDDSELVNTAGQGKAEANSFLLLDELKNQLRSEEERRESIQIKIDSARDSLTAARQQLEESEKRRRAVREDLEKNENTATHGKLDDEHELSKLASLALQELVRQERAALDISLLEQKVSEKRSEYLREQVAQASQSVSFSQQELEEKTAALGKVEADMRQQLTDVRRESQSVDRQWMEVKRRQKESPAHDPLLAEQAATWKLLHELHQEKVSFLQRGLGFVDIARVCWRRRHALANQGAAADELPEWREDVEVARSELARFKQVVGVRADARLGDLATLQKRLLDFGDQQTPIEGWIERRATEVEQSIGDYGSQLALLRTAERLLDRFAEELETAIEPHSARDWLAKTGQSINAWWSYEVTSVDDRPITVGKIVCGIILLLSGVLIARVVSRALGTRVLPRVGMDQGAAVAFQSIAFYLMVTCFSFLALEMINLPLTVFAFMGGAIAIGVGFGSQNILNNFISGLILLAERPIRVGDLVDIDGLNGTIEHIGARSTRVRTGSNLEIIVPNSRFLENNVTNWTLSNTRSRTMVSVGVAYGSPTREVTRLIRQATDEHPNILKDPEPIILFKEFGDNSLVFEVHFWIHMRTVMQGKKIASDVRHSLDAIFDQAKITIAFPQRDVHLDSLAPIEVNLRQAPQDQQQRFLRDEAA